MIWVECNKVYKVMNVMIINDLDRSGSDILFSAALPFGGITLDFGFPVLVARPGSRIGLHDLSQDFDHASSSTSSLTSHISPQPIF